MPIDRIELRRIVVRAAATAADLTEDELGDDVDLFSIGLDSLSFATILIDIEDTMGAEVPGEVLDGFLEVGDQVTIAKVVDLLSNWDPERSGGRGPLPDPIIVRGR